MASGSTNTEIFNSFLDLFDKMGFSDEQKKDLLQKMDEAVLYNFIGRVSDKLTDEQLKELESLKAGDAEEVLNYLKELLTEEVFKDMFLASVEEVWEKFFDKIS